MPRGISNASIMELRVTNRLLARRVKFLENRLKLLEGRLYKKNRGSIKYVKRESDKALAKPHQKIYKEALIKTK